MTATLTALRSATTRPSLEDAATALADEIKAVTEDFGCSRNQRLLLTSMAAQKLAETKADADMLGLIADYLLVSPSCALGSYAAGEYVLDCADKLRAVAAAWEDEARKTMEKSE